MVEDRMNDFRKELNSKINVKDLYIIVCFLRDLRKCYATWSLVICLGIIKNGIIKSWINIRDWGKNKLKITFFKWYHWRIID